MKNTLKVSILFALLTMSAYADCIRDNTNETVTCTNNKLIWQDNTEAKTVEEIGKTWNEAINYCENLSFAGRNDWRLPNINELLSIVDLKRFEPSINKTFRNTSFDYYWSSTSDTNYEHLAWAMDFSDGSTDNRDGLSRQNVRCVTAGQ